MPSSFFGLNIGKTGLYTYQSALDTTAHNITNTETKGYTRQVMGQRADRALKVNNTYGMAGTGVTVTGVTQMRNHYYDMKFWSNSTISGEYSTKEHYMNELQNYFNEVSVDGFTTTYNSMFDNLQELSKNPSSLTVRTQVVNYGKSLTEYFNSLAESIKQIQEECNFEIGNKVDQINSIAQQVATLTKQINTLEVGGVMANDIRDQRALLIDELSEVANITVTENIVGDGVGVTSYVVKLDGQTLVDTSEYNRLRQVPREHRINQNDVIGLYDIEWENGQKFNTNSPTLGGTLQALFEVRDGNNMENLRGRASATAGSNTLVVTDTNINGTDKYNIPISGTITVGNRDYHYTEVDIQTDPVSNKMIYTFIMDNPVPEDIGNVEASVGKSIDYKGIPYYMEQLNEFIRIFAGEFNRIHKTGEDLYGEDGQDFFEVPDDKYQNLTVDNFTVSEELLKDSGLIAAAAGEPEGEPDNGYLDNGVEDNSIAEALLALKTNITLFKQGTPGEFFQTLVADIGIDTSKAIDFAESQSNILQAITNQRLSVAGVDIDEEAMNLVRYQNAYNLSAKVISVMDEIYDKLINYMGV